MKTVKEYLREIRLEMESNGGVVDAQEMQREMLRRLPPDHPWFVALHARAARREVNDYCQGLLGLDGRRSHHQTVLIDPDGGEERTIYCEVVRMDDVQIRKTADAYVTRVLSNARAAQNFRDQVAESDHKIGTKAYVQTVLAFVDAFDLGEEGGEFAA